MRRRRDTSRPVAPLFSRGGLLPALLLAQAGGHPAETPGGLETPRMGTYEATLPEVPPEGTILAPLAPPDYPLGPGDVLRITYYGGVHAEFKVTVDHEGNAFVPAYTLPTYDPVTGEEKIVAPALGTIRAQGLTVPEFEEALNRVLSHLFKDVRAKVTLLELRTIRVHVLGDVAAPGVYYLNGISRVSDCLAKAGSVHYPGSHRNIRLYRASGEVEVLDLYAYLSEGDLTQNPYVFNEDRILVPQASKLVVAEGAVERPGIYELKDDEKLGDLIRMAGGVTPYCDVHHVRITSLEDPERDRTVDIYGLVFEGEEAEDYELEHGDRVSVPTLPYTVTVLGEVSEAGTFKYEPGNDFYYYLGQAGGPTKYGKVSWTKVRRWNGETVGLTPDLEVKPGDTFIVPRWEFVGFSDILQLITQAATVFFIVWQVSGTSK